MNRCQTLDFIFETFLNVIKFSNVKKIVKFWFYLQFYVLESVKEVVDSRVGNRVGTLIAYYSYDSLQINVIVVLIFIIWNMYKLCKKKK